MIRFPQSVSGKTIFALGLFALCMGIIGLPQPGAQLRMMGFDTVARPSAQSLALMSIISLATINTALLYLVGSVKDWPGLFVLLIVTRFIMGGGSLILALQGLGPAAFLGAAAWEWLGALLIGVARMWDVRRP
jgi:hypothetical protein